MKPRFKETTFTPLLILVIFAIIFASNMLPEEAIGKKTNPYLAVVVIQLLTYALPALFYSRVRGSKLTPGLRLRPFRPSHALFLVQSLIFMISANVLISMAMYKLSPTAFEASAVSEYAAFAMNRKFLDGMYLVVAFAVLPAITEEFVFRGIVIGEYQSKGLVIASLASAAMFAMSHFSLVRFPVYFLSGLVLSCVTFVTRSSVAAMLIHALNNAFVLLCEQYIMNAVDKQNISLTLLVIILGALMLVSCMLMCFEANGIFKKYAHANVESDHVPSNKTGALTRFVQVFFSPTFLLLSLVFIIACVATK